MTLRRRLTVLETRLAPPAASDGVARLLARLDGMRHAIMATGDLSHRADASPAENVGRAVLRGDTATARAILFAAAGRQP